LAIVYLPNNLRVNHIDPIIYIYIVAHIYISYSLDIHKFLNAAGKPSQRNLIGAAIKDSSVTEALDVLLVYGYKMI
jgi:hypothetical protein